MKRMYALLLLCAAAIAAFIALAPRQISSAVLKKPLHNCQTQSAVCPCTKSRVEIRKNGVSYFARMDGSLALTREGMGTTAEGHFWTTFTPSAFSGSVTDPGFGTISVFLDPVKVAPPSYMESLDDQNCFPAEHDVYVWSRMTISSIPGTTFEATTPFHMRNGSIPSFGVPHSAIVYSVLNDVDFEDPANPGVTFLTIKATPVTVNP